MDSLTFLHNIISNATSFLNFVLSVEMLIACGLGIRLGWLTDQATASKITVLGAITAIMFRFWQLWPHELVLLTVLPQCGFVVFVGGLVGCALRWVANQALFRN